MKLILANSYQDMSRKAANIISAQVIMKPNCVLGLATGGTPEGVYKQLIDWYNKGDIDFSQVTSINLDEYVGLGHDHPQSYWYYMQKHFFEHINIAPDHIFVPDGSNPNAEEVCRHYDEIIQHYGGIDLQLLGIGVDGHIGFNEPGSAFELGTHKVRLQKSTIQANKRYFASEEEVPVEAYTMGIKMIMQAHKVLLIASGAAKAEIVHQALFGPVTPQVPASILQMHPDLTVVLDHDASACIPR